MQNGWQFIDPIVPAPRALINCLTRLGKQLLSQAYCNHIPVDFNA